MPLTFYIYLLTKNHVSSESWSTVLISLLSYSNNFLRVSITSESLATKSKFNPNSSYLLSNTDDKPQYISMEVLSLNAYNDKIASKKNSQKFSKSALTAY